MMYLCSAVQVRSTPQSGSVAARSEVSMQNVFFFFLRSISTPYCMAYTASSQ